MKKKIIAGVLSASMLICSAEALPSSFASNLGVNVTVEAAVANGFEYKLLSDGTVEIIRYTGSSENVTIPEMLARKYVSRIGDAAFYMSNVKTVTIPATVKNIGNDSFRESAYLTDVKFLGTTRIDSYAFYKCTSLKNVSLNAGLNKIDDYVFYGCSALKNIVIPDTVTSIGGYCFENCSSLESVTLSKELTEISDDTFAWCTSLKSIRIPNKVKSVGWRAFSSCTALTQIIMPNSLKTISDEAFDRCNHLEKLSIPNSVTTIGDGAFENCTGLLDVVIPDSVTKIGKNAFGYIHATNSKVYEKIEKFAICGTTPVAQKYAEDNKFKFIDIRLSKGSVSLNKTVYVYNDNGVNADVVVKNSAGDVLKAGTDYELSYADNKKCGKATVTVNGKGKYIETVSENFIITPAKVTGVKVKSPKAKRVKVKWKKANGEVTGYEIQIARNKKFTKSLKTIDIKKANISKKTIKKLKSKKKYFVRVRAYKTIDNTKYYGNWSKIVSKKVKGKKAKSKKTKSNK